MKKRRAILSVAAAFGCFALAAGIFLVLRNHQESGSAQAVMAEAGENETYAYARIDSIVGNDMEVTVLEKKTEPAGGGFPEASSGMPEGGMKPAGFGGEAGGDGMPEQKQSVYQETGETKSIEIPVGTDVVTKLGAVTTFSRLASGDVIAVLCEADTGEILKVYIVE